MAVTIAPVWILCWLVGSLAAAGIELLRPRGLSQLIQTSIAGTFGAVSGQVLATWLGGLTILVGELHAPESILGAVLAILFARRLSA